MSTRPLIDVSEFISPELYKGTGSATAASVELSACRTLWAYEMQQGAPATPASSWHIRSRLHLKPRSNEASFFPQA